MSQPCMANYVTKARPGSQSMGKEAKIGLNGTRSTPDVYILRTRPKPPLYRHCEYQSFWYWHVYGDAQTVGPVYPLPAHCPQWVWVAPELDVVVVALVVVVLVLVLVVSVVLVVALVLVELVLVLVLPEEPPP